MCRQGWELRLSYLQIADENEREFYRLLYQDHLAGCATCRAYLREINDAAQAAVMPEMTE